MFRCLQMNRFLLAVCLTLLLPLSSHAETQSYPTKVIRVVVPFPAGGLVDGIARLLLPEVAKSVGQSIIIENRGGAGGSIGTAVVAQAEPDGYTLLMALDTHATNPLVYKKLPFDTLKDLAPISLIARAPMVALANQKFPPNTVRELIKYAKEHPGAVNFGSVGAGSASHLTGELFAQTAQVSMVHVPYKGGAPAQTDLMSGVIQLMWGTAPYAQSLVKAGKLKALGQAGATRSVAFANVPTLTEEGLPKLEVYGWIGLLAPSGTPPSIIAYWNEKLSEAVRNPALAKRLNEQGFEVVAGTPAAFDSFIRDEHNKWAKLISERNIPLN
jgi:tripartite-type tricarboxylate transporter receptor subunit TctC